MDSGVLRGRGNALSSCSPSLLSSNCAGCLTELQGHFCEVKIYVWGLSLRYWQTKPAYCSLQELAFIPEPLSHRCSLLIYITLHWNFGFLFKQALTQMVGMFFSARICISGCLCKLKLLSLACH